MVRTQWNKKEKEQDIRPISYDSIFQPESPAPMEPRERPASGERRLWSAVMLSAMEEKTKNDRRDVEAWLRIPGDGIATIEWICQALQLPTSFIKETILSAIKKEKVLYTPRVRTAA